jgi:hypothetical protein
MAFPSQSSFALQHRWRKRDHATFAPAYKRGPAWMSAVRGKRVCHFGNRPFRDFRFRAVNSLFFMTATMSSQAPLPDCDILTNGYRQM